MCAALLSEQIRPLYRVPPWNHNSKEEEEEEEEVFVTGMAIDVACHRTSNGTTAMAMAMALATATATNLLVSQQDDDDKDTLNSTFMC